MRRYPFAPGAITRHTRRWLPGTTAQRRELVAWLWLAVLAMILIGGTALVAGLLAGFFWS